ncbi:MAG: carboxylesterase family protein [Bryobacteraceae bacterium]
MRSYSRAMGWATLIAVSFAALAPAQDTVSVQTGKVKGVAADGLIAFKGIPYAAPPVGDLRWRPPQPAASWIGVRSAAEFSHDCMQLPFPSDAAPLGTPPAEDCLYLNVWVPAPRVSKSMPVMVWIYGGGFVNGGSSPAVYDGSQFARDGIVLVSFNYRLGRFGFFAHPALTKESPDGLLGNYAYMDQIAALRWVQRNITAFGGDPKDVTVFGESAGGASVNFLLTSPLGKGLFQKAIIESGGGRKGFSGGSPHLLEAANGHPSGEETGLAFARSKGITGEGAEALKQLRALPPNAIVDGLNLATMGNAANTFSGPMIDGKIMVGENSEIYDAGKEQRAPTIVGANSAEFGGMPGNTSTDPFKQFGEKADLARAAYNPNHTANLGAVAGAIAADRMMVEPARFVARSLSRIGVPAFEYRFSYVATSMRKEWSAGATHASEIPYVFDTVKARYGAALTPEDEKAAQDMHAYWVQFGKSGKPTPPGLPAWPRYSSRTDMLMDFTAEGPHPEADPRKARLDVVAP